MINIINNENIVEPLTIVLCNRDYTHIGQLSNISNIKYTGNLNSANELSFVINKKTDENEERFWDQIYNLKLVWVKELNEYFEIQVSTDDKTYLEKTITATSLCEAELSQTILHNIEINTEADISRDDYDVKFPTIFYRDLHDYVGDEYIKARNSSLMHRILDKVPAYSIKHVDASLANLQRTFSIDGTSVYDWLVGECSEQFNCIFIFNSYDRTIEVYDLYSNCNDCGHRGNFVDICPECGSTNIKDGYGKDTEIFCSTENLTDKIKFTTDTNSIKNCFRLVAGDDDMTAAVININPNGSQYIYNFSDESLLDMPQELVDKINSYDELYQEYVTSKEYTFNTLPTKTIGGNSKNFNNLVSKYQDSFYDARDKNLIQIPVYPNTFIGYANLIKYIYEGYELQSYLQSGMMPSSYTHGIINASTEVAKINNGDIGHEISLTSFSSATSVKTVESAILNYAKVFVKTGYVKLKINTNSFVNHNTYGTWTGYITVSNYSDENDVVDSIVFSMTVDDNYSSFIQQKTAKQIVNSTKEENDSIYNVLKPENSLEDFKTALTYYSLARIESFKDAIDAVLSVLQEAKQATQGAELYDSQYLPYFRKFVAANEEYNIRALECELCVDTLDMLLQFKSNIQEELDFKKYLDPDDSTHYYELFTTYIREDDYNNDNYISDGLNNDQLFDKAQEFYAAATEELIKSSNHQHAISSNLYNLLLLDEFKPLKNNFELGNWIRIKIEDNIYRLRLTSYSVDFNNLLNLSTEFSNLTKTADGLNDVKSIIKQASNMATSYNAVTKQSESGQAANNYLDAMIVNGLSTVNSKLKNNNNEEMTITAAGIIGKSYDDITDTFSPKQVRLTHNILAFTKDNWETVETALGEITYTDATGTTITDYGLIAKVVISGYIYGSTIEGGTIITPHIQNNDNSSYIDFSEDYNQYFIKMGDYFSIQKNGNIKSYSGYFSNYYNSNYINLTGNNLLFDKEIVVNSRNTINVDIPFYNNCTIKINRLDSFPENQIRARLYARNIESSNMVQVSYIYIKIGINDVYTMNESYTNYRLVLDNISDYPISLRTYIESTKSDLINFSNKFVVDSQGNISMNSNETRHLSATDIYSRSINVFNGFGEVINEHKTFANNQGGYVFECYNFTMPADLTITCDIYNYAPNTIRTLTLHYRKNSVNHYEDIVLDTTRNINTGSFDAILEKGVYDYISVYVNVQGNNSYYCDVYCSCESPAVQINDNGVFAHQISYLRLFDTGSIWSYKIDEETLDMKWKDSQGTIVSNFHVNLNGNCGLFMHGSNRHTILLSDSEVENDYQGTQWLKIYEDNIYCAGKGSVYWTGSDRKIKKNIADLSIEDARNLIYNVRPREFELIKDSGKRYGFIAQELREILDDDSGIEFYIEDLDMHNINYLDFIAPLCILVKDQQRQIDELKEKIQE